MTRSQAKKALAAARLPLLDAEDREGLLLEWTVFEPEQSELRELPPDLRTELRTELRNGLEIEDARDRRLDPLILLAIRQEMRGVRNGYLAAELRALGIAVEAVEGEEEKLEVCPCCHFRTLLMRHTYEVCPVCFWEDDETTREDEYSPGNAMTLRQARSTYAEIGVVDPSIADFRVEEPERIYLKA